MSPLRAMFVLGLLEAFGPLSMDLYSPQLPHLAASLGTSDALAQATMSACMIGLGVGQLIAGPLSDRFGRRRPLIVGVACFAVLSLASALAPTVLLLLVARALQGVAGSAGIVISLAVARDMFSGVELSRMLSLLGLVSGAAPIVAPLIGGQLALFMDWRGVFGVLAGLGVLLVALAFFALPETLGADARHVGGLRELGTNIGSVVRDRLFVSVLLGGALGGIAFFAYLSMSSFVFEDQFGFTAQLYSVVFALNSIANIGGGQLSRLIVRRAGPLRMYLTGVTATLLAASAFLVGTLAGMGVAGVIAALAVFLFATGLGGPNGSTLALTRHGARAGTAAAFLGSGMFLLGPVVTPLVAMLGTSAATMAITMTVTSALGALIGWLGVRPAARALLQRARPLPQNERPAAGTADMHELLGD
ncbi:multidrug effflux MFS transporter [Humibacter ginsenosidimutans]|uniref:Multidrug effflux MFS transporter n=1 Tax=Humibacter ginsenosidimutans TaxID=2599293 RepID=A0A5B8M4M1_9MICO|nr:multidrug effflux MFS transporter [Humibacter ginsenosidimutans]QDZ14622.1 multidrug effflux MFS transporter [Humibacter ginsenosidimutans]